MYLTNAGTLNQPLDAYELPPLRVVRSANPLSFANNNGYTFADKFVAFILEEYGKEVLFELMEGKPYRKVMGNNIKVIYSEWIEYLEVKYAND